MPSSDLGVFLGAAVRNPKLIGAVAPSSARLSTRLAVVVPSDRPVVVVELGPGTGAVTDAIARRLPEGSRHVAIELDPELADRVRATRPDVEVVTGDAADLAEILRGLGVGPVDAVVSGLPWSLIPPADQRRALTGVAGALAPGAAFTTFAYLHALRMKGARLLRALLHDTFDEVVVSRSVWRNAPPALTYVCRRPRTG
ncbi:class I SAM-dependent methyltransferase [Saccharothrix obliqua]|uniref:class I SAM-dependent methyltransferase n=1 Tax=Saccharothrix obliqua TaxID=2861747 RepID=UPI001C5F9FCB|nr:methyltransferase domain-containing protein [Saccharothrix obliqua]MBW4720388.1 methyltransferase domain-containing protein [Saccharothrix obliqua]